MKKIEKKQYLYKTFRKRRTGLFKKAEVLCHQFGDNINAAVVVLSPSGKLHGWDTPSADFVIDRYFLMQNQNQKKKKRVSHYDDHGGEVGPSNNEEIRSGEGEEVEEEDGLLCFLEKEVEGLDVDELKQLKDCLMVLKNNVEDRIEEMRMRRENLIDFFALEAYKNDLTN